MKPSELWGCGRIFVLPLLIAACANLGGGTSAGVDIRGTVTAVNAADAQGRQVGRLGSILVEGAVEVDTKVDKASIAVTAQTRIWEQVGSSRSPAGFDALKVGQQVQARFAGPVAESYPVQATAAEVVILR